MAADARAGLVAGDARLQRDGPQVDEAGARYLLQVLICSTNSY
jgi:hypothetical protein